MSGGVGEKLSKLECRSLSMKVLFFLGLFSTLVTGAPSTRLHAAEINNQTISQFDRELGRWRVTNSVKLGPGTFKDLDFVVETSRALGGLGIRADWYDAKTGVFFGEIIRTYNPSTEQIEQQYFAAAKSVWSSRAQHVTFTDNGYQSAFSGEDQYGVFEARSTTTFLPDHGGYDWIIERRYDGGEWFVIDRGKARPYMPGQ